MSARFIIVCSAFSGFVSVALGAFGAHMLREQLSTRLYDVLQTGIQYQMFHTLALLGVGLLVLRKPVKGLSLTAILFSAGIIFFSGSLYVLALSGQHWLGAVTPVGGLLFLAGWLNLGQLAYRQLS
ncbi:DUF423 domain-containing protein [Amphritea japonica]|uniref:DUF423 domain-containing protein n=1 Tax=Amphritea japonica ATCC BAA-1530 TaxID=1278309 RepID=A0A7R6P2R6_9GAMM|nr:DUF423 domain-containing protein [Amphritea japonica]BBB24744.1 conserved hypothetical protein [Amphritea japonica ATCC BAA-1530]